MNEKFKGLCGQDFILQELEGSRLFNCRETLLITVQKSKATGRLYLQCCSATSFPSPPTCTLSLPLICCQCFLTVILLLSPLASYQGYFSSLFTPVPYTSMLVSIYSFISSTEMIGQAEQELTVTSNFPVPQRISCPVCRGWKRG